MHKKSLWVVMVIALTLLSVQCGSSDNIPVTGPDIYAGKPAAIEPAGRNYLWGLWQISVEKATGEVSIVQLRQSDLAVNVLGFLEPPPLSNLSIDFDTLVIDPDNMYIGVDVIFKHPLITPEGVFHGFDVRGVVFGPALTNADGWTAMMNPDDFSFEPFGYMDGLLGAPDSFANYTGDWFGYKYFCDGLSLNENIVHFFSDEDELLNRGIFEEGQSNSRHYDLDFDVGGEYGEFLIFNYAVVASYNWPVGDPPFEIDEFDITTCNVAEAFCGSVTVLDSSLYAAGTGNIGGYISLGIEVWDWQGLGDTQVHISSNILQDSAPVPVTLPGSTSKSGYVEILNVPGEGTGAEGYHYIWAVATDNSETFGSSWFMALLGTGNTRYDDPVFTVFPLRLYIHGNTPPVAVAEASTLFPAIDREVTFDASGSHDGQSPIGELNFEWDFDGDGIFEFDAGTTPFAFHTFTSLGPYTVDLRVTDPEGVSDTLDEPLELEVTYCGEGNAHEDNEEEINISGFSVLPQSVPRYALAFLTEGPYAGQAVCQAGPYSLGVFDADDPGNVSSTTIATLRPYYLAPPGGTQPNIPFIIDVCPVGGYILIITDTRLRDGNQTIHLHKLDAYAPDGSSIVFSARDSANRVLNAVCALDCDENGDIWFVGWFAGLANNPMYLLGRIPYTGGTPPWESDMNLYDVWDITSYFPGMSDPTDPNVIIDMAIDYGDNRIYILHPGTDDEGKLSAFDMDEMTPLDPAYDSSASVTGVFSDVMKISNDYLGGPNPPDTEYWHQTWSYAGMEIDHEETDFERCRIVCYSRIDDGSGGTMPEVVRISSLGDILERENGTWALNNFGLNNDTDEGTRHMTFPGTNPMARLWDTPAEW